MQWGIKKILFCTISLSFLLTLLNVEIFDSFGEKIGISNNSVVKEDNTLFERHRSPEQTYVNEIPVVRRQIFPEEKKEPYSSLKRTMKHNKLLTDIDTTHKSLPPPVKINNIVIFLRFKGEDEFVTNEKMQLFKEHYNEDELSLQQYMKDVSYGQFQVVSDFFPTYGDGKFYSYEAKNSRNYYQPISSTNHEGYKGQQSANKREHELLNEVVSYCRAMIESRYPDPNDLDFGENGKVDNVVFVVKGSEDTWDDLLWPHQFAISGLDVRIHNKKVKIYNFMLESCFRPGNIGTSVHEFLHTKGFPDFYRYKSKGYPVGKWDLMSMQYPVPQFPLVYPRYKYGAFCNKPSAITEGGEYLLLPSTSKDYSKDIAYSVKSPVENRLRELFLIEYRTNVNKVDDSNVVPPKKICDVTFGASSNVAVNTYGVDKADEYDEPSKKDLEPKQGIYSWDQSLPDEGLLVYRVNKSVKRGNAESDGVTVPDNIFVFRKGISDPCLADGDIDNGAILKTGDDLGVVACKTKPAKENLEDTIYFSDGSNSGIRIYDVDLNLDTDSGEKSATFKIEFEKTFITKVKLSGAKIMLDVPNKKILFKLPKKFDKVFIAPEVEHNGTSIEPISGYPLVINNNMEYKVTSPTGITQKWQVITTPVGKLKYEPIKAKKSSQVSIKAEIQNNNGVSYQWYCDGRPIEGETDDQILLENPMDNKKHKYYVVASNIAGDSICANTEVEWEKTTQERKWPTFVSGILSFKQSVTQLGENGNNVASKRKRFSGNFEVKEQCNHKRNLSEGRCKRLSGIFDIGGFLGEMFVSPDNVNSGVENDESSDEEATENNIDVNTDVTVDENIPIEEEQKQEEQTVEELNLKEAEPVIQELQIDAINEEKETAELESESMSEYDTEKTEKDNEQLEEEELSSTEEKSREECTTELLPNNEQKELQTIDEKIEELKHDD